MSLLPSAWWWTVVVVTPSSRAPWGLTSLLSARLVYCYSGATPKLFSHSCWEGPGVDAQWVRGQQACVHGGPSSWEPTSWLSSTIQPSRVTSGDSSFSSCPHCAQHHDSLKLDCQAREGQVAGMSSQKTVTTEPPTAPAALSCAGHCPHSPEKDDS